MTFAALIAFTITASATINRLLRFDGLLAGIVSWVIPAALVMAGCYFQCGVLSGGDLVGCIPTAIGVAATGNRVFSWDVAKGLLGRVKFLRQPAVVRATTAN